MARLYIRSIKTGHKNGTAQHNNPPPPHPPQKTFQKKYGWAEKELQTMGRSIFAWRLDLQGDRRIVTQEKTRISKLVNPLLLKFGGFTKTDNNRAISLDSRFTQVGILLSKCPKLYGPKVDAPSNSDEEIRLLYKLEKTLYSQKQLPLPAQNKNMANLTTSEPKYIFAAQYMNTKPVRRATKMARKLAKKNQHEKFKLSNDKSDDEEEDRQVMQIEDKQGHMRKFTRRDAMTQPIAKRPRPAQEQDEDEQGEAPADTEDGNDSHEMSDDDGPSEGDSEEEQQEEEEDEETETDGRGAKHERTRSRADDDDGDGPGSSSSSDSSDSDNDNNSDPEDDSESEKDTSDEDQGDDDDDVDDDEDNDNDADEKDADEYVGKHTYTFAPSDKSKAKHKYVAPNQRSGSTPLYTRLIGKHGMISMSNKGQLLQLAYSHLAQCQDKSGNTRRWDHLQDFHGVRKKGSKTQIRPNSVDTANFDSFLARLNFKSAELTVREMHDMKTERACCAILHEKIVDVCEEACQRWITSGQAQLPKVRKKNFSADPAKAARQRSDEMRRQPAEIDMNALLNGELNEIINAVANAPSADDGMPTMQYLENIIKQSTSEAKVKRAHAVKRLLCSEIGDIKPYFSDRQVDGVEQLRGK